ncbi:MAG TPA: hypothetical protein VK070_09735, partial [Acidimicrobiia bacterium]|nr:hypothetical protein [Acidimicrobiia bacterium]
MRRLIALMAILAMLVAACGDGDSTETTAASGDTSAETTPETTSGTETTGSSDDSTAQGDPIRIGGSLGLTG